MQDFASEAQGKLSKRVPYSIVIFLSRGADFVLYTIWQVIALREENNTDLQKSASKR